MSSPSFSAIGLRVSAASGLPSGRPRWDMRITALAPFLSARSMVGMAPTMRCAERGSAGARSAKGEACTGYSAARQLSPRLRAGAALAGSRKKGSWASQRIRRGHGVAPVIFAGTNAIFARESDLGVGDGTGLVLGDVEVDAHEDALARDIDIRDALFVQVLRTNRAHHDQE